MLLHQGHFCFTKNFNALVNREGSSLCSTVAVKACSTNTCHRCFKNFNSRENLAAHLAKALCVKKLGIEVKNPVVLPELCWKNKDRTPDLRFRGQNKRVAQPVVVYADFETFFPNI